MANSFFKQKLMGRSFPFLLLNFALVIFQFLYIYFRIKYVNTLVPFWYTKIWGDYQLAPKNYLYFIPIISFSIVSSGALLNFFLKKYYVRYLEYLLGGLVTFCTVLLTISLVNIILIASVPFAPVISPLILNLALPMLTAFLLIYFFTPVFINFAKEHDLVTNPSVHTHPAMILQKPSARGGGFLYACVFVLTALVFVGFHEKLTGIYLSVVMLGLLGLADDFQNTHRMSSLKALENPFLRLFLVICSVSLVIVSGIKIEVVSNPFGGLFNLTEPPFMLGSFYLVSIAAVVTIVWLVLVPNLLSWSNGIDGQFAGIIGIASLTTAILALRFTPLEPIHQQAAMLAAISAGASFGFTKYTWFPSRIMWGFGAISAGLVISSLAILIQSKTVVTILIILIPFLDGLVTVIRRILQRKNPLKGDRGHLHHILLDRGWSVRQIAAFYWVTTIIFGIVGLFAPEKYILRLGFTIIGAIAFFILILNVWSVRVKKEK